MSTAPEKMTTPYSAVDTNKLSSMVPTELLEHCVKCEKPITGIAIKAMNKCWHENCFRCTKCDRSLKTGYQRKEEKPYCLKCFAELFLPKCGECGYVISDPNCFTAINKHWHEKCFACSKCKKPFKDGRYWVENGKLFCQNDFYEVKLQNAAQ